MRLLVDAHVFDGSFQGTRTYLEGLYTHMMQHKDIDFFFASTKEEKLKDFFGVADNIHYVHLNGEGRLKRLAIEFPQIIKENKIDYAHFQYITPLFKTCREIVTVHDLLFMDFPQYFPAKYKAKNKFFFRRSAKRADVLLTVSEFSKDEIVRHFGINGEDIHLTYNSILPSTEIADDIDLKKKYGLGKYVLTVSRIEPRKNHLALLKAFAELDLANRGYQLVMVGGKDLEYADFFDYYNGLAEYLRQSILFLQVPFCDLVALYRHASLFVFPSFGEGFGIPPIEAIAYGCPMLCSNATAMAEFGLPDEVLFSPNDIEELKEKMLKQLERPLDVSIYSGRVLSKYDWQQIADSFYDVLMKDWNSKKSITKQLNGGWYSLYNCLSFLFGKTRK